MLSGRVAIVTGAGRGIGAAVAKALAAEGAAVVVNDLGVQLNGNASEGSPAELVVREIAESGGQAIANSGDISDFDAAHGLVDAAVSAFGRLDILVNVAGIVRDRMIFNMTEDEWDAVVRVHLKGTFNTTRHASRHWHDTQGDGRRLINFTSGAALYGSPIQPNYAAAKMGIVGLTLSCANALYRYGVCSNAVSPTAWTRMTEIMSSSQTAGLGMTADMSPANVAAAVTYLASPEADWINGQVLAFRGRRLTLFTPYTPRAEAVAEGDLTPGRVGELIKPAFQPALDNTRPFAPPRDAATGK